MKYSLDDVRIDTKIPVDPNDVQTVFSIFARARAKLVGLKLAEFVELIQCRFAQNKQSGPVEMHFKCILAHPFLLSAFRYELECSMRIDWQEGGIQKAVELLVGKVRNRLNMVSRELSDVARLLESKD